MLDALRRIVTGHDAAGRSVIKIDGSPANTIMLGQGGLGLDRA